MSEPLKKTGDIPRYDSYPAPSMEEGRRIRDERFEQFGREPGKDVNRELINTAQKVGTLLGTAVGTVRSAAARTQEAGRDRGQSLKESAQIKIEQAKSRIDETVQQARYRANEVIDDVKNRANEVTMQMRERTRETTRRATNYARENQQHVLLGVAAAAFADGFALRLWRW